MSRKDDILKTFLSDPLIKENYSEEIKETDIENLNVRKAKESNIPIIKTIGTLIDYYHSSTHTVNDNNVKKEIINNLNIMCNDH